MPWPRPSVETIYERVKADMESRVTSGVKIPRVSLLGVMALTFAGATHLTYGFLVWLSKQLFVDTATTFGLERWGNILGLPRLAATYTTGVVSFTGTNGFTIAAGFEFTNSDGYAYTTDEAFTIGSTTSVTATAIDSSSLYNCSDSYMTVSSPSGDVDSTVTVLSGFDDGRDIETKEAWILRLLFRFQNPPSSGNAADYVRWAREINGVGKAWCLPLFSGDGTVAVVVATEDLEAVAGSIYSDAIPHIDEKKPIPADLLVMNASPQAVDFFITMSPSNAALQTAVEDNLRSLILLEAGPGETFEIPLSHIRRAIAAAGPYDYELTDIKVGGFSIGVDTITTKVPKVPRFGSVTF